MISAGERQDDRVRQHFQQDGRVTGRRWKKESPISPCSEVGEIDEVLLPHRLIEAELLAASACCWSAFRFSLMKAASGVPGISRNMKNRMVVTASSASALCVRRSRKSHGSTSSGPRASSTRSCIDEPRRDGARSRRRQCISRRQLLLLADRVVELAADDAVARPAGSLGLGEAGLHVVDRGIVPVAQHRRDVAVGGIAIACQAALTISRRSMAATARAGTSGRRTAGGGC